MLGYKYNTEIEAINAQKSCNAYYGIPKSEKDITKNWCTYDYSDGFWYIIYDESLEPILGIPIEITITNEEIN